MTAPNEIVSLINRFQNNFNKYTTTQYKEQQLCNEYITPFFENLGWDVSNKKGNIITYTDVVYDESIKIAGRTKRPDYSFGIGSHRKFFLEAKTPKITIRDHKESAFQLCRYGWSTSFDFSILTNFKEFSVYDCHIPPKITHDASHARILYLSYTDYLNQWDYLVERFSRDAIESGEFNKKLKLYKNKGIDKIDTVFLNEIESWRKHLAYNIANRNLHLSQRDINFVVQQLIDRIIFLRICEDRDIEVYGRLMHLQKGDSVYSRLFELFIEADEKYNSGLFHFKKEFVNDIYDELSQTIIIDDDVLRNIFKNLYPPNCPYEFSVLPADILGKVYEKFLGKVIQLTPQHHVKIIDKPDVKKDGGIFYTPTFIVEYIIKQTIECKKSNLDLKILDPACGSGAFLIVAYQFLLDWYLEYYTSDIKKWSKEKRSKLYQTKNNEWRLTIDERKRILLNHIYGVDIDYQAVEVTKLSLLLKVLEGENEQSINKQMTLFHERALPDLSNNIKCGNSLIDYDFYENKTSLDETEVTKINVFDWNTAFPIIMQNGGFDVVIGNPPYIFTRNKGFSESEKQYFQSKYKLCQYQINSFVLFIEKAFKLLKPKGFLGYVVPNNWLTLDMNYKLREFLLNETAHLQVINLGSNIFEDSSVDTCILRFQKARGDEIVFGEWQESEYGFEKGLVLYSPIKKTLVSGPKYYFQISKTKTNRFQDILNKIEVNSKKLHNLTLIKSAIKVYEVGAGLPKQTQDIKINRKYHSKVQIDNDWHKYLDGNNVSRYNLSWNGEYVKYGKNLSRKREEWLFEKPRILVRQIPNKPPYCIHAAYIEEKMINDSNSMIILQNQENIDLKYVLSMLNSKLISLWFYYTFDKFQRNTFPQFKISELKMFPIPEIEKKEQIVFIELTNKNIELHSDYQLATEKTKDVVKHQIEFINKKIDNLVYDLFHLTKEEIKMVEENQFNF